MSELQEGATEPAQDPLGSADASITAQLKAQSQAFKQSQSVPPAATPEVPQQASPEAPQKAQPTAPPTENVKEGPIDPQVVKEEKINESLARKVEDKETRIQKLLQQRDEMKKKLYAKGREAATLEKEVSQAAERYEGLTPDLKQKLLSKLESDPVGAIFEAAELVAERRTKPTEQQLAKLRQDAVDRWELERIDSLGQAGHPWVYTPEGQQWFQERFQKEPGLLELSDPYGSAVKLFQDELPVQQARQAAHAPAARGTPVLGVNSAVPPPVTAPPASPERNLENLSAAMQEAIRIGDRQEIDRLRLEMRRQASRLKFA